MDSQRHAVAAEARVIVEDISRRFAASYRPRCWEIPVAGRFSIAAATGRYLDLSLERADRA